ncbi:hypothetical protein FRB99_005745 [Tulasnella sp. 403]|nr:hypothetical protein FRB99_005745 [Tulasnella sp. 403]
MSLLKWIQSSSSSAAKNSASTAPSTSNSGPDCSVPSTKDAGDAGSSSSSQSGPDVKRFGMENFGNTCYANSVLQALYFCQPFRDLLLATPDSSLSTSTSATPSAPPPPTSTSTTVRRSPSNTGHKRAASTSVAPSDPPTQQTLDDFPSTPTAIPPIPSNPASLSSALRSLFYYISNHPQHKGIVAPQAFVTKLKKENVLFRSSMHQDAHEFLNYLLNKIVEDLEEGKGDVLTKSISSMTTSTSTSTAPSATSLSATSPPPPPPLVQSLFQGTLTNETRCLTCERVTSRSEPFLDLSLDISQNTSVNACLRHFSKSEMLTARNKFYCDECCGLVEAEKRMKIKTLPPVLLLHLKRFKYQEDLQKYVKLSYRVAFPLELRLYNNTVDPTSPDSGPETRSRRKPLHDLGTSERHEASGGSGGPPQHKGAGSDGPGDPEALYKLFAVVVHIGGGPHHGHYITLVKSPTTWLLFDDDSVEPIKESDIPKYFGDSNFNVEAAANATNSPTALGATGLGSATIGGGVGGMAVMGVPGGLIASSRVLAANPSSGNASGNAGKASNLAASNAASGLAPSGTVSGGTAATGTTQGATITGTGSGYVLFYQAADIDLKGLGLAAAVKEATEVGSALLAASELAARNAQHTQSRPLGDIEMAVADDRSPNPTATTPPIPAPLVVPPSQPPAQVFVEEPEDDDKMDVDDKPVRDSSPSFSSSSSSFAVDKRSSPPLAPSPSVGTSAAVGTSSASTRSARKSVRKRSKKDKETKDKEYAAVGTVSVSSAASDKSSPRISHKALPLLPADTPPFGTWLTDNGSPIGGPRLEERRSSEPSNATSIDTPLTLFPLRPTSMTENNATSEATIRGHRPGADTWEPSQPTIADSSSLLGRSHTPTRTSNDAPTTSDSLNVPPSQTAPRSTSLTSGSVPSSPTYPATRTSRFAPPRKSMTLFDSSNHNGYFSIGESPALKSDKKEKDDHHSGGAAGLMKRASRKMSLNSGTIRFGWNHHHREKDRGTAVAVEPPSAKS